MDVYAGIQEVSQDFYFPAKYSEKCFIPTCQDWFHNIWRKEYQNWLSYSAVSVCVTAGDIFGP